MDFQPTQLAKYSQFTRSCDSGACKPTSPASNKKLVVAVLAAATVVVAAAAVAHYRESIAGCFNATQDESSFCQGVTSGYNGASEFIAPKWTATSEFVASTWNSTYTACSDTLSSVGGMFSSRNATIVEVPVDSASA